MSVKESSVFKGVVRDQLGSLVPVLVGVSSLALFLVAHFTLSAWAELSELHHSIQHVLILTAGGGVGVATTIAVYQRKQKKS